ncbi:MAG: ubiquitin-like domain-containing protein [Promethearchaeota archaeon]
MGFDNDFDEDLDLDEELDEELDEDLEEDLEEPSTKTPEEVVESKTPALRVTTEGKKISVYFMSTIGPGEKKQKLNVNTGNNVGDIKETVANLFGLDPADFHLSSGGVTMDEGSFLKDYNINDGDDILLIPASTAG